MDTSDWTFLLGLSVVVSPVVLLALLGLPMIVGRRLSESTQANFTKAATLFGFLAAVAILVWMLTTGQRRIIIELGDWVAIEEEHFHFHLKFIFDRLSVPFAILSFTLCGVVGAFASLYLHREEGYSRFFLLYAFFLLGMIVSSLAGTIETLFFGWELVGLSSAMLVAYFHMRPAPVRNGHRIWSIYRISDAAFLIAALTMHHITGAGDFEAMTGVEPWPAGETAIASGSALGIGLLLLLAAAGKSAMVPFSGWLPRAMEGPTPSSAIFYGALSVHLGAFLLLRTNALLEVSVALRVAVVVLGLLSAIFGAMTSRVQTDVKNALAYASLTQVGIITVEIGLGFYYLALIHIIGHACLRTLQLLRSPSALKDHQMLENAVGTHLAASESIDVIPAKNPNPRAYRFAMHRGNLDAMIDQLLINPARKLLLWFDRMERHLTDRIEGNTSRDSGIVPAVDDSLEETE